MLTRQAQDTLAYIIGSIEERGYPPTVREIATRFRISVNGARCRLNTLCRNDAIRIDDLISRGIRIPNVRWQMVFLATREGRP